MDRFKRFAQWFSSHLFCFFYTTWKQEVSTDLTPSKNKPDWTSLPFSVLDWRMTDPNHPMNALMRLNQIHPGLQYRLLSQSGPVHAPVFTMSVDIQGTTYQATGNSKRTAKLQVALKVLLRVYIVNAKVGVCERHDQFVSSFCPRSTVCFWKLLFFICLLN